VFPQARKLHLIGRRRFFSNWFLVIIRVYQVCKVVTPSPCDANHGAGHANHTRGNGTEFAQNPLSLPSGPITRLRAKRFKEALNGLIQENGVDSKKTKMGPNNDQG
jgi:hypothetical protein